MFQNTAATKVPYALKSYADFRAQILESQLSGLPLKIDGNEVWVKLRHLMLIIYGNLWNGY
jgi:UDP-N-acetylmuramoyl-L-alanyl-D-glutamate--2,6-diaminopimelate ligase